jgi:hypothetical protein
MNRSSEYTAAGSMNRGSEYTAWQKEGHFTILYHVMRLSYYTVMKGKYEVVSHTLFQNHEVVSHTLFQNHEESLERTGKWLILEFCINKIMQV